MDNNIQADNEIEQQVIFIHDLFWKALADRDVENRFRYCDDAVTFIGSGLNEKAANKEEYIAINKRGIEQYPEKFDMNIVWRRISVSENLAWVETEVEWQMLFDGRNEMEMLRNTVVLKRSKEQWLIVHVHGSMPDYRLLGQNYMTNADTSKRNVELEKQVFLRTRELNQAMENLKSTQAQLIQSEKMASLGELTAGIAHEIQNPLNFVKNFSEVTNELISEMVDEVDKGNTDEIKIIAKDVQQNLEKILHHGKRADAIVKGMLAHSRTNSGQKEPTDLNALCDEYLRLAYHGLKARDKLFNASFQLVQDISLPKVNVVPQDIGRVLLNLINNAFQAVNGFGDNPTVRVETLKRENFIEIKVTDNGPGIPAAIRDKIFQPFFTTKPTGQGTGLGLSLSYDIVKAHGGEIKVDMKENEGPPAGQAGTEFTIQLPII